MSNDEAALHILEKELEDWQASPEGMQLQKDGEARRLVWETLDQLRDHPAVQASPRVLGSLNTVLVELHSVFNPADVLAVTQREAIAQQTRNTGAKKAGIARHAPTKDIREHILNWCDNWKATHPKLTKKGLAEACGPSAMKWNDEVGNPFAWENLHDAIDYIKEQLKPSKRRTMRA